MGKKSKQGRLKKGLVIFQLNQCLNGWWAVSVINLNKSPNHGPNAVGGNTDLFFFQQYNGSKISAQAYGLNGYLLTSVNEWPAREHEGIRDRKRESSSEKQGLR